MYNWYWSKVDDLKERYLVSKQNANIAPLTSYICLCRSNGGRVLKNDLFISPPTPTHTHPNYTYVGIGTTHHTARKLNKKVPSGLASCFLSLSIGTFSFIFCYLSFLPLNHCLFKKLQNYDCCVMKEIRGRQLQSTRV